MSTERRSDLTMSEAAEMLTIGEIGLIEKRYGQHFGSDEMSAVSQMAGVIWAFERRRVLGAGGKFAWADVDAMTMKDCNDYFAPEPVEADEADPDSESGKGEQPAA